MRDIYVLKTMDIFVISTLLSQSVFLRDSGSLYL